MKLKLILLSIVLLISIESFTQSKINAFHASQWINLINKKDPNYLSDYFKEVVKNPFSTKSTINSDSLYIELNALNDRINEFKSKYIDLTPEALGGALKSVVSPEKQTLLIDAAAKIVAEQFKEGVTKMYLNNLKKKLDEIPELQALFPETYDLLDNSSPFDFPDLDSDFKKAFENDLRAMPKNLVQFIDSSKADPYAKWRSKKWYPPVRLSFDIGDKLIAGYHPAEVLNYLDEKYESPPYDTIDSDLNNRLKDYHNYIKTINVIQFNFQDLEKNNSTSLFGSQYENLWIKFSDLKKLNTKEEITYLIALIYYQLPTPVQTKFKKLMDNAYGSNIKSITVNNIDESKIKNVYTESFLPFLEILHKIEALTADKVSNAEEVELLMEYLLEAFELVYYMLGTSGEITVNGEQVKIDNVIALSKKGLSIYSSIIDKDYNRIIPDVIYLMKILMNNDNGVITSPEFLELVNAFSKYGNFIEAVAKAETSDELSEIIKKEITSFDYLKKRSSLSSLTLSAHPGVFAGVERLNEKTNDKDKTLLGLTAPIGIEWTYNIRKWKSKSGSAKHLHYMKNDKVKTLSSATLGFFVQLVDIGAVVNYRLNDSESELPESITFKQVFSPGGAVHYGFRNSPITLGVGYQYTPEIREVTVDDIVEKSNAGRVFIRLTWDINFIKFYAKTKG